MTNNSQNTPKILLGDNVSYEKHKDYNKRDPWYYCFSSRKTILRKFLTKKQSLDFLGDSRRFWNFQILEDSRSFREEYSAMGHSHIFSILQEI